MLMNIITYGKKPFSATVFVSYPAQSIVILMNNTTMEIVETIAAGTHTSHTFTITEEASYYVLIEENGGDERTAMTEVFTPTNGASLRYSLTYPESAWTATLSVIFPAGLTCMVTNGTTTLYSSGSSGYYEFTVTDPGQWTAKAAGCNDKSIRITDKGSSNSLRLRYAVTVNVTGNHETATYDGSSHSVSGYTIISSRNDYTAASFTFSGTASASRTNNGTTNMGLSAAQFTNTNDEYEATFNVTDGYVTINRKAVTVRADAKSKTYGDTDPTLTATVSGTVGSDTISYSLSRASGEDYGTYTITPSGNATQGNYTVTYSTANFTINRKAVTIKANNASKNAGAADPTLTATVTGLVGTDTVSYSLSRTSGETAGTYTISVSATSPQGNYTITTQNGTFTINAVTPVVTTVTLMATGPVGVTGIIITDADTGEIVGYVYGRDISVTATVGHSYHITGSGFSPVYYHYVDGTKNPDYVPLSN